MAVEGLLCAGPWPGPGESTEVNQTLENKSSVGGGHFNRESQVSWRRECAQDPEGGVTDPVRLEAGGRVTCNGLPRRACLSRMPR